MFHKRHRWEEIGSLLRLALPARFFPCARFFLLTFFAICHPCLPLAPSLREAVLMQALGEPVWEEPWVEGSACAYSTAGQSPQN